MAHVSAAPSFFFFFYTKPTHVYVSCTKMHLRSGKNGKRKEKEMFSSFPICCHIEHGWPIMQRPAVLYRSCSTERLNTYCTFTLLQKGKQKWKEISKTENKTISHPPPKKMKKKKKRCFSFFKCQGYKYSMCYASRKIKKKYKFNSLCLSVDGEKILGIHLRNMKENFPFSQLQDRFYHQLDLLVLSAMDFNEILSESNLFFPFPLWTSTAGAINGNGHCNESMQRLSVF